MAFERPILLLSQLFADKHSAGMSTLHLLRCQLKFRLFCAICGDNVGVFEDGYFADTQAGVVRQHDHRPHKR